ncbi:hypothetical protein [Streptomyces sp. NPDC047097]|uniref:hypothetical protein n=1 Tax=Streptomyces sp. NPDC047097 TaxID=3155260 RepID=UPI0033D07ABE
MDPANEVVRLCGEGMRAEADGRGTDALALFRQAWERAGDDYEACVAAHYLARHQPSPEQTLHWNRVCLERADRVGDERVRAFYPSLHAAMGRAHQDLGNTSAAGDHFARAAHCLDVLPPDPYADWVRFAVAEGLAATRGPARRTGERELTALVQGWCARGELRALALVLPARLGDTGTQEDRTRLTTALQMLHATRRLPDDEQQLLGRTIAALAEESAGVGREA